jgi:hypothetical protein
MFLQLIEEGFEPETFHCRAFRGRRVQEVTRIYDCDKCKNVSTMDSMSTEKVHVDFGQLSCSDSLLEKMRPKLSDVLLLNHRGIWFEVLVHSG